jgi:ArsR family transcriptional regulator, arsenate/arsenite/antimonite-responsive transcriptional repressor
MNELVNLFKAMSDQTRLRIMILLLNQDHCVCELTEMLNVPQTKISKHLGKLRDLGLVSTIRDAQFIYYHLNLEYPLLSNLLNSIDKNQFPILLKDQLASCMCTTMIKDQQKEVKSL